LNFEIASQHATPHGVLTAVNIPDTPDPVPEAVLANLPPEEREFAESLRGYVQVQFVGGRIALRSAAKQIGFSPGPLLRNDRGAPVLPEGLAGSVSHKRTLAVAMVARSNGATLGVDLEDYGPPRPTIAPRVLTPAELVEIEDLPADRHWTAVVLRFSLKEALYKALDPYVNRYVGFHEAQVFPDLYGTARISLDLANGEIGFACEGRYEWFRGRVLTSARVLRSA
jgi:enterobactin synthetase component D